MCDFYRGKKGKGDIRCPHQAEQCCGQALNPSLSADSLATVLLARPIYIKEDLGLSGSSCISAMGERHQ